MRRILFFISIVLSLSFIFYGFPPKDCSICYEKLNNIKNIRILTIKEIKGSNRYEIDLLNIKNALELVGIEDKISIELFINNKLLINLGYYSPSMKNNRTGYYTMKKKIGKFPASIKKHLKSDKSKYTLMIKSFNGKHKVSKRIRIRVVR